MSPWPCRCSPRRATRLCSTCPGASRWRTGPPTSSSRCRAASPGTSCGSSGSARRCTRSRRSPRALALREYGLLRQLERRDLPAVEAVGGRRPAGWTTTGQPLDPALVTRHLQFSLPYRALFSSTLRPDTADRLLDALAALLVRLHTAGFYWGDCSFSNTLFRRDAGAFAAYLVDAETGELHGGAVRGTAGVRRRPGPHQHRRRAARPGRRRPAAPVDRPGRHR